MLHPALSRKIGYRAALGAGIVLAFAQASCAAGTSGDQDAKSVDPAAEAAIQEYSDIPTFSPDGESFDAEATMAGKVVYNINPTSENPFNVLLADREKLIADEIGFDFIDVPNNGTPTEWARGIETAINADADLILAAGLDPTLITPQLEAAKEAGIPVVSQMTYGTTQEPPENLADLISALVYGPYELAGKLVADWVAVDSDGTANVLVLGSDDIIGGRAEAEAIESEFDRVCAVCKVKLVNIPTTSWASQTASTVGSAIAQDPNLEYIVPVFDSQTQLILPAVTAAGAGDRVKVASFNGTPFVLEFLQKDAGVVANVGLCMDCVAYMTIDQLMRVLADVPTVDTSELAPLRIFSQENVDEAGTPPDVLNGYGDQYKAAYENLWKIG